MNQKPSLREALKFWFKLGFISFGGPAGQVAIMHEFLVEKKKWISESRFLHALNYCMLLPGPEAQQLATYTGWLLHGVRGGLAAGVLFILPSMFILLGLSILYVVYGQIAWVHALFDGLKPAVVAIVAFALVKIGKRSLKGVYHYLVALAAFIAIFFFKVPFPLIILSAVLLGILVGKWLPAIHAKGAGGQAEASLDEVGYLVNNNTGVATRPWSPFRSAALLLLFGALWSIPFLLLSSGEDGRFWQVLILFFTKAALVTFGGAYAVLPYVAQVSVEKLHWLTATQMMDGLALGETTPGPLIMVLAFVGFMAAYNFFNASLIMAGVGLVITVHYTFLPCFLFIFAGAPIIERTRDNPAIKNVLTVITAAVVGVVLNLSIYLLIHVVYTGPVGEGRLHVPHLIWMIVSFIALFRFRQNMIFWLFISALYGLVGYLFSVWV